MTPAPSAEFQVSFLTHLQRILQEGSFTATYKFALVHALADLCVQKGDETGDALPLRVHDIAVRFVELYWRQAMPWQGPEVGEVLAQNTGGQAAVIRLIREARESYGERLDLLRGREEAWQGLTADVGRVVRVMPLWRLQTVGDETHEFLYENGRFEGRGAARAIVLRPGIAYCFRTFHSLVIDLVRADWLRFVRRRNPRSLGETNELGEFLFGVPRTNLAAIRGALTALQDSRCFYCDGRLDGPVNVDHFVPWARYPVDLGHNFVAAHDRCNSNKSDHLAGGMHLERWARRNRTHGYELGSVFDDLGMPHDLAASHRVARWAYGQVAGRRGVVWIRGRELVPLEEGWENHFA